MREHFGKISAWLEHQPKGRNFARKNNSDERRKRQNEALIFFIYFFASRQKKKMGLGKAQCKKITKRLFEG